MNSLPQELFHQIISYLPPDDKESLRSCSLVTKSWTYTSRKRLFEFVGTRPGNLRPWLDGISQENVELLGHVRQLTCSQEELSTVWPMVPANNTLRHNLRSLCDLRHFTLSCVPVLLPSRIEVLSVLGLTLSSVTLSHCMVSKSALVALFNILPGLKRLCLEQLYYFDFHEQASLPLRSPLKGLHIINRGPGNFLNLLDELSELGLCSDELTLGPIFPSHEWTAFTNHILRAFGAGAKCLRLPHIPSGPERLTLSACRELLELEFEISAYPLNEMELDFISSITSTNIEKIIINRSAELNHPVDDAVWTQLDDILTELAGQRGYQLVRLEVEFRGNWDFDQKMNYLPKFVERGRMIVCDRWSSYPIYCSDGPRGRK